MKQFKGRPVAAGKCTAKALVSHNGFNTLASFQKSLQFGDKTAKCGDQNNPDLFGKPMVGTALCLPQTIGSTTGGMVLYCAKVMGRTPACTMTGSLVKIIISWRRINSAPMLIAMEITSEMRSERIQTRSAWSGSPLPM